MKEDIKILQNNWLKHGIKKGDDVIITRNLKQETDYATLCYDSCLLQFKGQVGKVSAIDTTSTSRESGELLPIAVQIDFEKSKGLWFSFNWVQKV